MEGYAAGPNKKKVVTNFLRFPENYDFPICAGSVDGTQIRTVKPFDFISLCPSNKTYLSIQVLAICNNFSF